ncbi:pyridoxamine 5'-phosphate oxidase [Saccharicrinis fermentans]|nr:pyridoxamine 5'-phosphate oxidase [Saccharicrinis fermentans]
MNRDLSDIRNDFVKKELSEEHLSSDAIEQMKDWLNEAIENHEPEPTAMTLCTVSSSGVPSARIVLLKNIDERGNLWFYTNYSSRKGTDLKDNNHAAVNFFWPGLERQLRITGTVEKLAAEISDGYFESRPVDSQASAIASPQSQVVDSRAQLEQWFNEAKQGKMKRPANWGGYRLQASEIEFWQGRAGRLHDRVRYRHEKEEWVRERLAP